MSDTPEPVEPLREDRATPLASSSIAIVEGAPTTSALMVLVRDRAELSPALARGLTVAVIALALTPALALAVVVVQAPDGEPLLPLSPPPERPIDTAAVAAALDVIDAEARAARDAAVALTRRAIDAERGDRLRVLQKVIAKARDARRAAGQAGAALRGPFPVAELGDVAALSLSEARWLATRDGVVVAPANVVSPADIGAAGREEEPARIDATLNGRDVALERRCVPYEPYCLIDVEDRAAPPPAVPVTTAAARAALVALAAPQPPATAPTTTAAASSPGPPTAPLVALAVTASALAAYIVTRLRRLSGAVRQATLRLRTPPGSVRSHRPAHGVAELDALEAAIDEALGALSDGDDGGRPHQRARLAQIADALAHAHTRPPTPVGTNEADDPGVARVALMTDELFAALRGRALRTSLALEEVEASAALFGPLAQRLLRLARVTEIPAAVADELASLGTALGQKARAPSALPALQAELAAQLPERRDAMVDAAALTTLPSADAVRLGSRREPSSVDRASGDAPPLTDRTSPLNPPQPSAVRSE